MRLKRDLWCKAVMTIAVLLGSLICLYAQEFAGGQGTEEDPWQIETAEHLNNVRNYLGEAHSDKHFIQTEIIDLHDATREGGAYWNDGEGWEAIGDRDNVFYGHYNGNNLRIEGIYINRPTNYQGLFGHKASAVIKNLGVTNVDITGHLYAGGLVGRSVSSTISNSYSTGSVTGYLFVGGIVGACRRGSIGNSYSTASVTGNNKVGGLVGEFGRDASIRSSYSTGNVTGDAIIGGLVGSCYIGSTISNSYSTGSVTGRWEVGGLAGTCYSRTTISNSYNTGNVSGRNRVGGLVGFASSNSTISNSYSTGSVTGEEDFGGLLGSVSGDDPNIADIINSYWDMQTSGLDTSIGGEGRTTEEMTYPYSDTTYIDWDFEDIWVVDEVFLNGGYPYLYYQEFDQNPYPIVAVNPNPKNGARDVPVDTSELGWIYEEHEQFDNPEGFRVYFGDTYEFDEDDEYDWVDYLEEQSNYISTDLLSEELLPCTDYYWVVIPTNDAGDAERVSVWTFRTGRYPYPAEASNPSPEDSTAGVPVELDTLRWNYIVDTLFVNPEGFRVYFNDTGEFNDNDDYEWVAYVDNQVEYSTSGILPEVLGYDTFYYWMAVPTTKEEGEGEGSDAQDVPVWSFITEADPTSVDLFDRELITSLHGNYPNPFNPDTFIKFSIKEDTEAYLHIYNIKGQLVKTLHDDVIRAGNHSLIWDGKDDNGKDVGSGVYLYRLKTDHYDQVNKMLLIK